MKFNAKTIAGLGLLTAIVVVLQALSLNIRFGMFSITLTLVPIIVGSALYGKEAGAWLGFVFSFVVLLTDTAVFMAISIPGTLLTVLLKGTLAGFFAGLVYTLLRKNNHLLAVIVAGIVAPVVNTGIFVIGCFLFFYDTILTWAQEAGYESGAAYIFTFLVGLNFVVELLINLALSTVIVQIINIGLHQQERA